MKKTLLFFCGVIGLGIFAGLMICLLHANSLNTQLKNANQSVQQMKSEIDRVKEEKDKLAKQNEKLQVDAVLYVGLNNDLQQEKEKLQKSLANVLKSVNDKEAELKKQKAMLIKISKKNTELQSGAQEKLAKEKEKLLKKIKTVESDLQKERALYNYNLGVAYSQAGLYDEAISAYIKSLESNPNNPEAHYNLGVLFADFKNDPDAAIEHYNKYLQLKPNADDKEEVEALIKKLE